VPFRFLGTLIRYERGFDRYPNINNYLNLRFIETEISKILKENYSRVLAYLGVIFAYEFFIFGNPLIFSGHTLQESKNGLVEEGKLITYMNPLASAHYGQATLLNGSIIVTILAIIECL
jgi:hypothetical protein